MNVVAITDIHGHTHFHGSVTHAIENADLILIAGDITNFGGKKEAQSILHTITVLNKNVFAVPGNCDQLSVNQILVEQKYNLHGEMKIIKKSVLYGIGGCKKTPFHTPQEYSESEIAELLRGFERQADARFHVLVSHTPPYRTTLDKMFLGLHVGSKAIRVFIEKFQPDLVICGHIHEARGSDTIGKSIIINPGPFPEHFAIINLTESISYDLY